MYVMPTVSRPTLSMACSHVRHAIRAQWVKKDYSYKKDDFFSLFALIVMPLTRHHRHGLKRCARNRLLLSRHVAWNRRPIKASMEVTSDMFPQDHREAWLELFIKYNTPLPSSAAVERLFSMASDVLRAKRSCLTAENFENLIFMKGNMDIMSLKIQQEEEQ